jgi:pyruvate formate lyase activating enzyme
MQGHINSIQSLGTLDGPGIRYVIFFQGCNLRCGCCHNPDTWNINEGKITSAEELINNAKRYKEYFKNSGGITISGGEPLLQAEFAKEIFELAHKENINTCLDTSGSILNEHVKELLDVTDYVLLDIKYTSNDLYLKHVGCNLDKVVEFLSYLNKLNKPTVIRQVIIPSLNDSIEDVLKLKEIISNYSCVKKIELLPFKKICQSKYDNLNIEFPFKYLETPSNELMDKLNNLINRE